MEVDKQFRDLHMQVMWNRLISVVEEQATSLIRTAFSTSVREAGDLSAGVFDARGQMIAQAVTGTPGHVNAMAEAVGHFISVIGRANIFEGDVYITNDPWRGTGHLHDVTVVCPSFYRGTLIGYFASTAHVVDIGGRGFGPDANEVYEEGLFIPIMKMAERGKLNQDLLNIVRHNVRESDQVVGDLHALAACNAIGHSRLVDMLGEFHTRDLGVLADFIFERSYSATMENIARLPTGSYYNSMRVDGYDSPIDLHVRVDVTADGVHADFAGSSGPSAFGINVPLVYTKAYAGYGLKCAIAPDVPNNAASLRPFSVTAPETCILNARHPAAVAVRHVLGHFLPDVILGAVHQFLPQVAPAEGASALWNLHISTRPLRARRANVIAQRTEVLIFNSGGTGARPSLDGLNATAFPSGVQTMSVEAIEQIAPLIVWRKELRERSGGAGKYRGGLGQVVEIAATEGHDFQFNAMCDRIENPALGRDGGAPGAKGRVYLDDGTPLRGKGRQHVPEGRRLIMELPGGGGYGPADERSFEQAAQDRVLGY